MARFTRRVFTTERTESTERKDFNAESAENAEYYPPRYPLKREEVRWRCPLSHL
jgi:hypothetical protein